MKKRNISNEQLPDKWKKLLGSLPRYDPFRDASGFHFDIAEAERAVKFFPLFIKHIKGRGFAGRPFNLEFWQKALVANIFGWKDDKGLRRYREVFLMVPRKNGKTTLVAGLGLLLLLCDQEPGAEVYSIAAERDQAAICFKIAGSMVKADEVLCKKAEVYERSIVVPETESCYKPLSHEAGSKHGYNASAVINDELHAQPSGDLIDALETGMGTRQQPLIIHITTSDYERESICNEKYQQAVNVRDGLWKDARFLPAIYEAGLNDNWKDPIVWAKANPNLGVSITEEYLQRQCEKAMRNPRFENEFKRLHLNIKTRQKVKWLDMVRWLECARQGINIETLKGLQCFAGLDLASKVDINALVLVFPIENEEVVELLRLPETAQGGYILFPYFWIPEERALERQQADHVPYLLWADQGHIELTNGDVCDQDTIFQRIMQINDMFELTEIAFDPWDATHISTKLGEEGFTMVEFRQGYASMTGPCKEFEAQILARRIFHNNNPVLNWMASNIIVEQDPAGNIKPAKNKSAEKIDGIVAAIMGIGRAMVSENGTSLNTGMHIEVI